MTIQDMLILLIVIGILWTALWLWVMLSVPHIQSESIVNEGAARLRRRVVVPFIVILLVGIGFSLYWAPYPNIRARTIGQPEVTVDVSAIQWGWILSETKVPVDTNIEFAVTSQDVNHGFAIYSPDGELLTQVQAMPGYTNNLIYKFDEPGEYTVRCLELCGLGHHIMVTTFTVA